MEILESTKAASTTFGEEPLLVSPDGRVIDLAHGYVPLLTDFTFEDKAAKGLRKGKTEKDGEPPVFFSALELVRDHKALLLSGSSGSGKTTFAKHLCFRLATTGSIKTHPLIRNEIGIIHEDQWKYADIWPCYFAISGSETLKGWIDSTLYTLAEYFSTARHETVPNVLIVLDTIRLVNKSVVVKSVRQLEVLVQVNQLEPHF
jgi:iron(II)-dependent oxidoreductase